MGAAMLLLLAGCTAALEGATEGEKPEGVAEASAESVGEGQGEGAVVGYPMGWPEEELPLFDGTLLNFAHPGNLWAGWVESTDLVADLATAQQLLVDAGYTITLSSDGYFEFSNPDRKGRVVAAVDPTWGPCLLYTFTDGAEEAADAEQQDAAPAPEE